MIRAMVFITGIVLFALITTGCGVSSTPRSSTEKGLSTKVVTLKVGGMTCDACAFSVKTALKSVEGVKEAKVRFEKGEAEVRYIEGTATVDQMIEAISKIGYAASLPR